MKRPVVKIVPTIGEKIVELLGLLTVICMVIFPYVIYDKLPEIIPTHMNILGDIDGYGNKDSFSLLPFFGLIVYIGISILQKYPHAFNYPVEVNEENYLQLYTLGIKCLRNIKIIVTLTIAYITYHFACNAFGIKVSIIPVTFLTSGVFITLIYYIIKMSKCK